MIRIFHGENANIEEVRNGIEAELAMQRKALTFMQAIRNPTINQGIFISFMIGVANFMSGVDVMFTMNTIMLGE